MSVLRRGHVLVEPDTTGFDKKLVDQVRKQDPGGKAGKQIGGQLGRSLAKLDLPPIDLKADPKTAIAGITATEVRLRALAANAPDIEVKIQTEKALGQLIRFRKQLGDVAEDAGEESAGGFVARFTARLGPLIGSAPVGSAMGAGMGALGLALAPTLAAGIAGGLTAGVGLGGIVAGIKLVAKDPQVEAAGKDVGKRFSDGVALEAQAFKTPVLGALKDIDGLAGRSQQRIGNIFRNTAPAVEGLTKNLVAAGDAIGVGLEAASSRAEGPLRAVGELVQGIGTEFGKMIDTLSQRSDEGALAIKDIQDAATGTIRATTAVVSGAAAFRGWTQDVHNAGRQAVEWVEDSSALSKAFSDVGFSLDLTADGYKKNSEAGELFRQGLIGRAGATNDYAAYLKKAREATAELTYGTMSAEKPQKAFVGTLNAGERAALGQRDALTALSNQLRAQADPAFALINAQNTLKTAQDKAAEATRKHGRNSVEARAATRELATAALDLQGKAGALGDSFNGKLSPSMRTALQAAGLTERQIKAVGREFKSAKAEGDKFAKNYKASASLTGQAKVGSELWILSQVQQALKKGSAIPSGAVGALNKSLRGARMADGGRVQGYSPSPTADNIDAKLTADEWVIKQPSARRMERENPGALRYINQHGELPRFAAGGQVTWPYPVNAAGTWRPTYQQVVNSVVPAGPSGGATAPWMEKMLEARFGAQMISGFRPGSRTLSGNLSWHARNKAVDFPAIKAMAAFMDANYGPRMLEAITPWQQYNRLRGKRHSYSGAVWNQHNFAGGNAHNHFAMDHGGIGVLQPGVNAVYNGTGRPEPIAGPNAMAGSTYNITVNVPVGAHPAETGRQVVVAIQAFERSNGSRWRK